MATQDNVVGQPTYLDIEKFRVFNALMLDKYLKGRAKHGVKVVIDPLVEAQAECLDLANYAMMTYIKLENLKKLVEEASK